MKIHKDRGSFSGYRLQVPTSSGLPVTHIGEYHLSKRFLLHAHVHETWELLLQLAGTSTWSYGGRQVEVATGALLVCPPGLVHGKNRRETTDFRFLWVGCQIDPALWPLLKGHVSEKTMTVLPQAQEAAPYLRTLERELLFEQDRRQEGVVLAWKQLWLAVYRLAAGSERLWGRREGWLVPRVRTLVEAQPGERWTLAAMSQTMGYAPSYFAELFKRESGQSFHQYLMAARVQAAQAALALGRESATEIALKLGFSSSQHFSRVFARLTGLPPKRWHLEAGPAGRAQLSWTGGGSPPGRRLTHLPTGQRQRI